MNHIDLDKLYEATSEDLLFTIGVMLTKNAPTPYIQIFYRDWTRQQLELVRASFKGGLALAFGKPKQGKCDLYLATREEIAIQADEDGHTAVLRAPAWDARLANADHIVVESFEANRRQHGCFLLLVQTPDWEFVTGIGDREVGITIGVVERRSLPVPIAQMQDP